MWKKAKECFALSKFNDQLTIKSEVFWYDGAAREAVRTQEDHKSISRCEGLNEVDFDLYPGEIHSLCGENGAGKSTLIKVMTGAHERTSGAYLVDGKEVFFKSTHEAIETGISCVYQELSIAPQLDIAQNLYIGNLPVKGGFIDYPTLYKDSREILEELGMESISPKTLCGYLSVGQQQMIEIGRALTRNAPGNHHGRTYIVIIRGGDRYPIQDNSEAESQGD